MKEIKLPLICRCEPCYTPKLGIFGECLRVKSRKLSINQLIEFGVYDKSYVYNTNRCNFYLIYMGKRPNLRKIIDKIEWIESDEEYNGVY